jgi:Helix-turn-helix domain
LFTEQIEAEHLISILEAQGFAPEAARAAFDATEARDAPAPKPAALRPRGPAVRRERMFGMGRPRALDRNAKIRIMHLARCLSRRTEKGRAYGVITAKALAVLNAILWSFHNAKSGLCFPGYEAIAAAAGCARSTVAKAIKALEEAGIMTWVHRIKRVRVACPDLFGGEGSRIVPQRTSNAYHFADPGSPPGRPDLPKSEKPTRTKNQAFFSSLGAAFGGDRPALRAEEGAFEEGDGAIGGA